VVVVVVVVVVMRMMMKCKVKETSMDFGFSLQNKITAHLNQTQPVQKITGNRGERMATKEHKVYKIYFTTYL
jgi:hypothetical protein